MSTNTAEKEKPARKKRVNAKKLASEIKKSRERKGPLAGSKAKAPKVKATKRVRKDTVAKPKREKKAKVAKELKLIDTIDLPEPDEGSKSGAYIQKLLALNSFTTQEIVLAVRHHFKDSVAAASDVNYHRYQLKLAKTPSKLVMVNKEGQRHIVR